MKRFPTWLQSDKSGNDMKKILSLLLLTVAFLLCGEEARQVKVVLFPFREAVIVAKVDGTVQAYKCRVGERFKTGDVLMTIDDTLYKIELERAEALAEEARVLAVFAQETYEAQKKLFEEAFESRLEIQRRETEAISAAAKKRVADANCEESRLTLGYCTYKAPFDGRMEEILCREYETVRVGQPLFRILDDTQLLAVMNIPVSELVPLGSTLKFSFGDGKIEAEGKVCEISPRADHRSGTIEIKAVISNTAGTLTAGLTGVLLNGK